MFLVCAKSNSLAVLVMSGINLKGAFVVDIRMAFLRTGPGMKTADPSKLTLPVSSGNGVLETSWAVSHSASS